MKLGLIGLGRMGANMARRLMRAGHELVVFDVNRSEVVQGLLAQGPLDDLETLRNATGRPFAITLIGSASIGATGPDARALAAYRREAGGSEISVTPLPFTWPAGVFSLGHTALPVPAEARDLILNGNARRLFGVRH